VLVDIEPDRDLLAMSDAQAKCEKQEFVIALTPFASTSILEAADLLLPIGTFAETSGTYVNVAGTWQSFSGVAKPVGESRPAWKVLRVLGNLVGAPGFEYATSEDVRDELARSLGDITPDNNYQGTTKFAKVDAADGALAEIDTPIYSVDALVRRATALQLTAAAARATSVDDA